MKHPQTKAFGVPCELRRAGGALRNEGDGAGWFVIDNGTHYHTGLGTPYTDGMKLVIPLSPPGDFTGFGSVTADESLGRIGVTLGPSGSKDELRIEFACGGVQIGPNNSLIKGRPRNIWVSWDVPHIIEEQP